MSNSKKIIRDTFIELYLEKPIHKITVTALTKKANITRGTFYIYFSDIYEVLEEIENDIINFLKSKLDIHKFKENILNKSFNASLTIYELLLYAKENKLYFKALLGVHSYSSFKYKLKNIIKENFCFILNGQKVYLNSTSFDFYIEYLASAHIGCIIFWIDNNCTTPINDVITMINKIFNSGILNLYS